MTSPGDLPDWTEATANQGVIVASGILAAAGSKQVNVSLFDSLTVLIINNVANQNIVVELDWFSDNTFGLETNTAYISGIAIPGQQGKVAVETPLFSGFLQLSNLAGSSISYIVFGSSRVVPNFKYLNNTNPGRFFTYIGVITNGVNITIPHGDAVIYPFASNGESTIELNSNTNGNMYFQYVDSGGTTRIFFVGVLVANVSSTVTVALPQCVGSFLFAPTATNAAGLVEVTANPAQL